MKLNIFSILHYGVIQICLETELVVIKSWFENVIDILDTNGNIYNFEQLKETYSLKGTFLGYQGLISKLPRTWLEAINEQKDKCIFLKYNVQMNCYIMLIMKDKKCCRKIYDKIVPVKEQLNKDRWNTELGHITNEEQNKVNSSLKYINEIKLRDFQFKINNKILVTNSCSMMFHVVLLMEYISLSL